MSINGKFVNNGVKQHLYLQFIKACYNYRSFKQVVDKLLNLIIEIYIYKSVTDSDVNDSLIEKSIIDCVTKWRNKSLIEEP